MPFADNVTSYPDCGALFDQALASAKGLRIKFDTPGEAVFQAGRFNAFRVRHRRQNARIYPAEHPLHKASEYDGIMVRVRENVVELHKLSVDNFDITALE